MEPLLSDPSSPWQKTRLACLRFFPDGKTLFLAGGKNQGNPKDKKKWGRIVHYEIT